MSAPSARPAWPENRRGRGPRDLGGTCLNVGCIPSKALLHATHQLHEVHENFEKMGLMGAKPTVDWERRCWPTRTMWSGNTKGIEFLFKKNKITWLKGWGSIPAPAGQGRRRVHSAKNIVIATGSEPLESCPASPSMRKVVVTSTGALTLPRSRNPWS
jgi:dihydrolipoamide dehydrogenase